MNAFRTQAFLSAMILLVFPSAVVAQSCEEAVTRFYQKLASDGLVQCIGCFHPDELAKLNLKARTYYERIAISENGRRKTPREVGIASKTESWSEVTSHEYMLAMLRIMGKVYSGVYELRSKSDLEVVGHVDRGDIQFVIILWKIKIMDKTIEKLSVACTKLYEGRAMVLLPEDVAQSLTLFEAQFDFPPIAAPLSAPR